MALYKILIKPVFERSGFKVPEKVNLKDEDSEQVFADMFAVNLLFPSNANELFTRVHLMWKAVTKERLLFMECQKRIVAGVYCGAAKVPKLQPIQSLFEDFDSDRVLPQKASESNLKGPASSYFNGKFSQDLFRRPCLKTKAIFSVFKVRHETGSIPFCNAIMAKIYNFSADFISSAEGGEQKKPNQVLALVLKSLLANANETSILVKSIHPENEALKEKDFSTYFAQYRWTIFRSLLKQFKYSCMKLLEQKISELASKDFSGYLSEMPEEMPTVGLGDLTPTEAQLAQEEEFPGTLSLFRPPMLYYKQFYFPPDENNVNPTLDSDCCMYNLFHKDRGYNVCPFGQGTFTPQILGFLINLITSVGCTTGGLEALTNVFENNGNRSTKNWPKDGFVYDFVVPQSESFLEYSVVVSVF